MSQLWRILFSPEVSKACSPSEAFWHTDLFSCAPVFSPPTLVVVVALTKHLSWVKLSAVNCKRARLIDPLTKSVKQVLCYLNFTEEHTEV